MDICKYICIYKYKIHGDYYCLLYICVKTYVYIDIKIPWRYTKIDLFELYGVFNRWGIQTYVARCKRTTERNRMNYMGIIITEYHVVYVYDISYVPIVSTVTTHGFIRGITYGCSV